MNTETREIRPFSSFKEMDRLIHSLQLKVGDRLIGNSGHLVLEEDEFRRLPIKLDLPDVGNMRNAVRAVHDEIMHRDLDLEDLVLAVNLFSSYLKISEFTHLLPLADLPNQEDGLLLTPEHERPKALRAARSGCRIEVAVLLAKQKSPAIGRPWRKGTWLSRATFTLTCESEFGGFVPRPMDAVTKVELRIPPGATRYIVVPAGIDPLVDQASPEVVEMWVDADLLANLSARDKLPSSVAFQKQLFIDAFACVMSEVRSRSDFGEKTWNEVEETMFGKMIAALAGRSASDNDEHFNQRCGNLMSLLKEDFARFMAHVEAFAELTPSIVKSLGD